MNELTKKVFEKIDELSDKYLNMLVDVCNIESKSDDKEGVDKVGDYLAAVAKELDYTIRKKEFEKAGNVYSFAYNPGGKKNMISLSAHMDTVFDKGAFGYPPVKIQGDYIYGPGVQDCKGGIVIFLLAMEALKKCNYDERCVKLILQSDEEVGSKLSEMGTIDFMLEEAKGSAAFLNGEGYAEGHGDGYITVGRKGIVRKKIKIKGKACHAGICTEGISAIKEAAHKIIELEKENDTDSITFNCGIINGGTTVNTVPESCELHVEYRFKTREQQKEAEDRLNKIVNTSYVEGAESVAEELSNRAPMERTEANENLARIVSDISVKCGLGELEMRESAGGADSAYTTLAGIPTIDSIGAGGSGCHSIGEKVLISSISEKAKLAAGIIINFPD